MKWERWVQKRPEILVAVYDSAQPYDGPGEIVTRDDGTKMLITPGGERYPLENGGLITIQERGGNQIVGYNTRDKLVRTWEPVV